jgi:UDP-N-acetylglucosamine 2-epimerase (non-hydrolysing)
MSQTAKAMTAVIPSVRAKFLQSCDIRPNTHSKTGFRIIMKIISVVGARPNFMKIAPFIRALHTHNQTADTKSQVEHLLVHTGQHYDDRMSRVFFEDLNIPDADINLGVGSGSHAEQVGHTMIAFEKVLQKEKPDWVVVVGDVNATCACSITAKKEHVKCAHIEAGLRSRDMTMPEEINRLVTDRLSDLLLTRIACPAKICAKKACLNQPSSLWATS